MVQVVDIPVFASAVKEETPVMEMMCPVDFDEDAVKVTDTAVAVDRLKDESAMVHDVAVPNGEPTDGLGSDAQRTPTTLQATGAAAGAAISAWLGSPPP